MLNSLKTLRVIATIIIFAFVLYCIVLYHNYSATTQHLDTPLHSTLPQTKPSQQRHTLHNNNTAAPVTQHVNDDHGVAGEHHGGSDPHLLLIAEQVAWLEEELEEVRRS